MTLISERADLEMARFAIRNATTAERVEIVERAMKAIKESRPRPFDQMELRLFQHALDREFDL